MQIATLQSQLSEIQRSGEETRAELKRLSELVAEQNALLRKSAADKRTNDEAMAVGLRELSERVSELAEAIQAIKATFPLPPANMSVDPNAPRLAERPQRRRVRAARRRRRARPPSRPRVRRPRRASSTARPTPTTRAATTTSRCRASPSTCAPTPAPTSPTTRSTGSASACTARRCTPRRSRPGTAAASDFPSSDKLPDARVKKGMALERLGRKSQALVEYRYVVDRYPTSQAARIARERLNP